MDQRQLAAYLEAVEQKIAEYGWMVQGVGATATEPVTHYTVGLWESAHFELLAFGLDHATGVGVLNILADRVIKGERFTHGQFVDEVARDQKLMMIEVPSAARQLKIVSAYYGLSRKEAVPAWQVVYPDAQHRWPWDEASGVASLPVLGPVPGTGGMA